MVSKPIRRYALIPDSSDRTNGPVRPVRRFHLARIAGSPRSALGQDRHERMEQVAQANGNGSGPGHRL